MGCRYVRQKACTKQSDGEAGVNVVMVLQSMFHNQWDDTFIYFTVISENFILWGNNVRKESADVQMILQEQNFITVCAKRWFDIRSVLLDFDGIKSKLICFVVLSMKVLVWTLYKLFPIFPVQLLQLTLACSDSCSDRILRNYYMQSIDLVSVISSTFSTVTVKAKLLELLLPI